MGRKVALFHTSFVFFNREPILFELLGELLPDAKLVNIVEDRMLSEVIERGGITPDVISRICFYALALEAMKVDAILNTCSSVGPAFDVAKQLVSTPIIKIDEGMAEKAARDGKKIAVLATVPTTIKPTIDLLREKAASLHKEVDVQGALCEGAFDLLMQDDVEQHDEMVSKKAEETSQWADTLVLAQCSMAHLACRLSNETRRPVLSSPRLGIENLATVLEKII